MSALLVYTAVVFKTLQIHLQRRIVFLLKDSDGSVAFPVKSCESSNTLDTLTTQIKQERLLDTRDSFTYFVGLRQ